MHNLGQVGLKRDSKLDIIRGVAVMMMVFAHAAFFMSDNSGFFVRAFSGFANYSVFIILLFTSGAATFLAYSHPLKPYLKRTGSHLEHRVMVLVFGYYLVALGSVLKGVSLQDVTQLLRLVLEVLSFQKVPSFSEFIIPYIFFSVFYLYCRKILDFVTKSPATMTIVGLVTFVIASFLFNLPVWPGFTVLKSLVVGEESYFSFPFMQYFPVFIAGYWWGKVISGQYAQKVKDRAGLVALSVSVFIFIGSYVGFRWSGFQIFDPTTRWPPSLGFLGYGLTVTFILYLLLSFLPSGFLNNPWDRFIAYLGRDAFDIYIVHLLILFFYERFINFHTGNQLIFASMYITLMAVTVIISSLNWRVSPSVFRLGPISFGGYGRYRIKRKYVAVLIIFLVCAVFGQSGNSQTIGAYMTRQDVVTPLLNLIPPEVVLNRKWFVKTDTHDNQIFLEIMVNNKDPRRSIYTYRIHNTDLEGDFSSVSTGRYFARLDIGNLNPGEYMATVTEIQSGYTTGRPFIVSYPLYVAWTLDWEGWDVPDTALNRIRQLPQIHYRIPLTHFFNPRLFIARDILPERIAYITDWLKDNMTENRDAVGLHLHMQYDLVEQAGVTPKSSPDWGYLNGQGYDVPLTAYSPEEQARIVRFALTEMVLRGFTDIKGFRAGGWFADVDTLTVLAAAGLKYDSSGRQHLIWKGSQKSPWDLDVDAQPYYPDKKNQNISSPDHLELLEIPNNGGNTYEHDAATLITNFGKIRSRPYQDKAAAMVFLSHPQWAERELPIANEVLTYMDNFLYERDFGPVIYVTTDAIFEEWK